MVILVSALFVKRNAILKGEEEGEDEDEVELPPTSSSSSADIEEGCDDGRHNISYPLPPSSVTHTRAYKKNEHSERPIQTLSCREQSNTWAPGISGSIISKE